METEIQQLTDQSTKMYAKLSEDDAKIITQQMQKEKLLLAMDSYKESSLKAQHKCDAFEKKQRQLHDQLVHMETERADLSNFPEKSQAQQKIKDELEKEVAALKLELRQLKPEPHLVPSKVSSICEI